MGPSTRASRRTFFAGACALAVLACGREPPPRAPSPPPADPDPALPQRSALGRSAEVGDVGPPVGAHARPLRDDRREHDGRLTDADRMEGLAWRFHVGGPAGAPAVGPDGASYVGTTEGRVYAIGPAGRLLWSYTVSGPVIGGPATDGHGRIYVATSNGDLYALRSAGSVAWVYRSRVPIVSGPALGLGGEIYFGARDRHVYAVSPRGAGRWRAPAYDAITAGPIVGPDGRVIVVTKTPKLVFLQGVLRRRSVRLRRGVLVDPTVDGGGTAYVLAGQRLVAVAPSGRTVWSRPGIQYAPAVYAGGLALLAAGAVLWLDRDGGERRSAPLPIAPSATPAALDDGTVLVPGEEGALFIVDVRGDGRSVRITSAPIRRPALDRGRGRAVVAAGDGTVAAVTIARTPG